MGLVMVVTCCEGRGGKRPREEIGSPALFIELTIVCGKLACFNYSHFLFLCGSLDAKKVQKTVDLADSRRQKEKTKICSFDRGENDKKRAKARGMCLKIDTYFFSFHFFFVMVSVFITVAVARTVY